LNSEKQKDICDNKSIVRRRTSSRVSVSSISSLSHRQSITSNPKMRSSRSFSRASFMSANSMFQDNLHLLKSIHQATSEPVAESIKNGIHVEFKLSSQNEQKKQKSMMKTHLCLSKSYFFLLVVLFDVPKPYMNLAEDITFTQNKCKCLLAETKQKMFDFIFDFLIKDSFFYE